MQIIWNINDFQAESQHVVSLGTFDGIHLGHQAILSTLQENAARQHLQHAMITFEPHPQLVIGKKNKGVVRILTTIEEKIAIFTSLGLEKLIVVQFSPALAAMEPTRFVEEILLNKLRMREIIIGYDHAFGAGRRGNRQLLQNLGHQRGFIVTTQEPVVVNGVTISSTKIRELLNQGKVKSAAVLLGRYYSVSGQVIAGDARGRQLGYPTLNVRPYSQYKLIPEAGIYATRCRIDGVRHHSVTYIGARPTFSGKVRQIETHLFDFDENAYGKEVEIEFIDFIRADQKFADETSLVKQIEEDLRISKELLQKEAS